MARIAMDSAYLSLFAKHVTHADQGCDFDFLVGRSPDNEPAIF
jgi:hypothetical protein